MIEHTLSESRRDPESRRRMRAIPNLDTAQADTFLSFEDDFRGTKRDRSLEHVVEHASLDAIMQHAFAIAAGPAAHAMWKRVQQDPHRLSELALEIITSADERAADITLALLVTDPQDPFSLGIPTRVSLAEAALTSQNARIRGLAAEFLAAASPRSFLSLLDRSLLDSDDRSRAVAWRVAFLHQPADAHERALAILADERLDLSVRRSALLAAGAHLPTDALVELLAWFVVHPDPQLAGDAVDLLHDFHRNPLVAEAALHSPHARVREVAERLLDPLRGSPAAGGNRPGSPVDTSAIFEALIRRETRE